jgi:hypothetical protein
MAISWALIANDRLTGLPQPVCLPTYQQTLSVSVTVEYRVG